MTNDSQLTALVNAVPMPMVLLDHDERIVLQNASATAHLGAGAGRHYLTVIRQPEVVAAVEQVLAGAPGVAVSWRVSGRGRDAIFRGQVTRVEGLGVSIAFEDVSELEHTAEMRRDFVANVSHELRTPLTALLGFIETLRGAAKNDPVAQARFLSIMEREALRMNRLVGDLLSLSRVEGEERVRPQTLIDLGQLSTSVLATLKGLAESSGVTLAHRIDADLPQLRGDVDQLTQVLHNLVENGIKYGGAGGELRIEVTRIAHDAQLRAPAVSVAVIDQGEGIAAEHLPRLTERFYRVDSHRSREQGGTGLGLAIVKHILNRHRGRLRIESAKGKGSRFEVLLPID